MGWDTYLPSHIKVWITNLNVRVKTVTLNKNNIGINLCDLGLAMVSYMTPHTQKKKHKEATKEKILNYVKI